MVGALRAAVFYVLLIGGMLFFIAPEANSLIGFLMVFAAAWLWLLFGYPNKDDNFPAFVFFVVAVYIGLAIVMDIFGVAAPHFDAPPPPVGGY